MEITECLESGISLSIKSVKDREDKKKQIIIAALKSISENGMNTTIADIAMKAGVQNSIIYQFFKNKKDLLYHAMGEAIQRKTLELKDYLQGIREPVSQLSKLIWVQLSSQKNQSQYMAFSIFNCRADMDFLQHNEVCHFIRWREILKKIFDDGVKDGSFSQDLNTSIVCEMILGLIDMESILVVTGHRKEDVVSDFDDIMDIILSMVCCNDNKSHPLDKRKAILDAAKVIFSEKGYEKATAVEIAKSANVSTGTLYEYFKNKEDILFSTLQNRFQDHVNSLDELFEMKSPTRKLRQFIEHHFLMYLRDSIFLKTFLSEGIYNQRFYQSDSYLEFQQYMKTIDLILKEGKADGCFRPNLNIRVFRNLILGAFCNLSLRSYFTCGEEKHDMIKSIHEAISLLMRAALQNCEIDI